MSEEGGYGVAADAAESAARQSGIQLIPDPRSDLISTAQLPRPSLSRTKWRASRALFAFSLIMSQRLRVAPWKGDE